MPRQVKKLCMVVFPCNVCFVVLLLMSRIEFFFTFFTLTRMFFQEVCRLYLRSRLSSFSRLNDIFGYWLCERNEMRFSFFFVYVCVVCLLSQPPYRGPFEDVISAGEEEEDEEDEDGSDVIRSDVSNSNEYSVHVFFSTCCCGGTPFRNSSRDTIKQINLGYTPLPGELLWTHQLAPALAAPGCSCCTRCLD